MNPIIIAGGGGGKEFAIAHRIDEKTYYLLDDGITERRWTTAFSEACRYRTRERAERVCAELCRDSDGNPTRECGGTQ